MMVATELANLLLERADSSAQLRPAQLSSPSHVTSQPTIDYVCARARHFSAPPPRRSPATATSPARSSSSLLARLSSRLSAHAEERQVCTIWSCFAPNQHEESGRNRTKRSSSASQSPPRGTHAHVNDPHVGVSDFGPASSKLSSPRLFLAVSRAVAHDFVFFGPKSTRREWSKPY